MTTLAVIGLLWLLLSVPVGIFFGRMAALNTPPEPPDQP